MHRVKTLFDFEFLRWMVFLEHIWANEIPHKLNAWQLRENVNDSKHFAIFAHIFKHLNDSRYVKDSKHRWELIGSSSYYDAEKQRLIKTISLYLT